ncbi:MAG: DNA-3-methyladenine glycosylase 2 family protein [Acetobacteraceae bacterium]|nr:DNA-3-methyladenine glycosylase 2 family protein [Acetobacteraceae bacterium]
MRNAIRHLNGVDPAMQALIRRVGRCGYVQEKREPYEALVRAITHQQLHGSAARTILGRFMALYPSVPFPTPEQVLSTSDEAMRRCGLSGSKTAAIRDIALKTLDGVVPNRRAAARQSDAELIARLTVIRGVGRWTVEMLLMFNLGRFDILPVDDFGVREGYRRLHGLDAQPKPRELAAIGEMWSPWRSVASWYLWRAAEEGRPVKPAA